MIGNWQRKAAPILLSVFLVVLPLVSTSILSYYFIENEAFFLGFSVVGWMLFSMSSIFTQAFALTPPTFCGLVLGYFWGWKTLPFLVFANLCSIFIVVFLSQRLNKDFLMRFISSKPKALILLDKIKKEELKIITLTKLSPVLPFTLTNVVFALSGAKFKNILLGGFMGMIPRTVLSIWTGTQAKEIRNLLENPNEGLVEKMVLFLLVLVSVFGLLWVLNRAISKT